MARPDGLTTTYNYVIITTKKIVAASKSLNSFVAHKQAQGYSVLVVTEDQYGGDADWPASRAQKIRQWLINNYLAHSIEYVLLIGDPTPYDPGIIRCGSRRCPDENVLAGAPVLWTRMATRSDRISPPITCTPI